MDLKRFSRGFAVSAFAAAAMGFPGAAKADIPIPSTTVGEITHINTDAQKFTMKLGNGINHQVHYAKSKFTGISGMEELRVGEKVKVFSGAVDPKDRGLDASEVVVISGAPGSDEGATSGGFSGSGYHSHSSTRRHHYAGHHRRHVSRRHHAHHRVHHKRHRHRAHHRAHHKSRRRDAR